LILRLILRGRRRPRIEYSKKRLDFPFTAIRYIEGHAIYARSERRAVIRRAVRSKNTNCRITRYARAAYDPVKRKGANATTLPKSIPLESSEKRQHIQHIRASIFKSKSRVASALSPPNNSTPRVAKTRLETHREIQVGTNERSDLDDRDAWRVTYVDDRTLPPSPPPQIGLTFLPAIVRNRYRDCYEIAIARSVEETGVGRGIRTSELPAKGRDSRLKNGGDSPPVHPRSSNEKLGYFIPLPSAGSFPCYVNCAR